MNLRMCRRVGASDKVRCRIDPLERPIVPHDLKKSRTSVGA
jgi:hypothetical protein